MDKLFELNKKLYSAHTGVGFGVIASSKQTVVVPVGGWVELGRTTLGSANATIDVTGLADKRYYMFLINDTRTAGATDGFLRLNQISTSTYAQRVSTNGGADGSAASVTGMGYNIDTSADQNFCVGYIANISGKEKLAQYWRVSKGTSGAANAPNRREWVGKHAQTSNPVTAIGINSGGANTYSIGSEVVVLEWDPADVHTDNFWELLGEDTLGSAGDILDSGTITAKKYLWIQYFGIRAGDIVADITFNSDTGSNYSQRSSFDGGADGTSINQSSIQLGNSASFNEFANLFVVNVSGNEKLAIAHVVGAAPSGAGTAPSRLERVFKWANTSASITKVTLTNAQAGNFAIGSMLRVWGSN